MSAVDELLVKYDAWWIQRKALGDIEADGGHVKDGEWVDTDADAIDLLHSLVDAIRPAALPAFVVQYADRRDYLTDDEPSELEIRCPSCGAEDVREVDEAIAWNELEIGQSGAVVAYIGDMGDRQQTGFICASCATHLDAPDGFTIENWR